MKEFIKRLLRVRNLYSLLLKIRGYNILVHNGAKCTMKKGSSMKGSSKLNFNVSHYGNGFHRVGNLVMRENSILELKNGGQVTIYSGCKIDLFPKSSLSIGNNVYINEMVRLGTKCKIEIGDNTVIGDGTSIHDYDGHKINGKEGIVPIKIGNHVWVGENVTILKGVEIGDNVVIGACSVVTKDIPSNTVAVGNPARIIKKLDNWN